MSNIKFPLLQRKDWIRRSAATMTRTEIAKAAAIGGNKPKPTAVADAIRRANVQGTGMQRYQGGRMGSVKINRDKGIVGLSSEGWSDAVIGRAFHLSASAIRKIRLKPSVSNSASK